MLIKIHHYYLNRPFIDSFNSEFTYFIISGFIAQIIDGALGMAYGISCSSFLLYFGLSPVASSASVHAAEVFTTGVSGLSHIILGNIDKKLFLRIVITGIIGAILGAYLISKVFDGKIIKPFISVYLLILGIIIIVKAIRNINDNKSLRYAPVLGFAGGLLDTIGGGGWGPIVASNLIRKGYTPKLVIGTVNTAEFFVAFVGTGVFIIFTPLQYWQAILGLIIGGVLAAPLGAYLIKYIPVKIMTLIVGLLVIALSVLNLCRVII